MAEEIANTRDEARKRVIAAMQDNGRKLRKAMADNDKAAIAQYTAVADKLDNQYRNIGLLGEIGTGIAGAATGLLTFPADLAVGGYNLVTGSNVPTLRDKVLEAAGMSPVAMSQEGSAVQAAPDVTLGAVGAYQLGKLGYQGIKSLFETRKVNNLLKKLPEAEQNTFKDLMLKGQGSGNTEVQALINKVRANPKYSEIFNALDVAAAERATAGMAPAVSRISDQGAAVQAAKSVQNKLEGLAEARSTAGKLGFEKAFGYGEGRALVEPTQTLAEIDRLIGQYSKQASPNAEKAVEVLTAIREKFQPTQTAVYGAQPGKTITAPSKDAFGNIIKPAEQTYRDASGMTRALTEQTTLGGGVGIPSQTKMVQKTDATGNPVFESYRDASGMSHQRPVMVEVRVGGSPATTGVTLSPEQQQMTTTVLQSSKGTSVSYRNAPEKLTAEEVQSILSEFGKKASTGDSLVKDLALSDEKVISSAIFGKMKDDLNTAFTNASGADRTALGFLQKARKDVEVASKQYSDAVAQGLPAWLKDKPLSSIDFEELMAQYSAVSPAQRATFREYVKANDPEALKNIDGRIWADFKAKYTGELPDGSMGTDLARMAQDWSKMGLQEKDAVASALGQNVNEFSTRMKDALIFTRKAKTGAETESTAANELINKAAAVVGASPAGYSGAKATQLSGGILSAFRSGVISDELAMKTLMSPEGAAFLKQGKLTPGSMETLDKLMKTGNAQVSPPTFTPKAQAAMVGGAISPAPKGEPTPAPIDDWVIPEDVVPATSSSTEDNWVIPE